MRYIFILSCLCLWWLSSNFLLPLWRYIYDKRDVVSRKNIFCNRSPYWRCITQRGRIWSDSWIITIWLCPVPGAGCTTWKYTCVPFSILYCLYFRKCKWMQFQGYLWVKARPSFLAPPEFLPWEKLAEDQSWTIPEFWGVMYLLNFEQDYVYILYTVHVYWVIGVRCKCNH